MENLTELTLRIQRSDNLNVVKFDNTVGAGNGRHYYEIERADTGETLAKIHFQEGARKDESCALTHIEEALMWLNKRKEDRKGRNVLGTYNK